MSAPLPDYPWESNIAEIDGIQIAYLDLGDPSAPPVWMLHGEPTWSYLWRHVIPPVLAAGYRVIAPDMAGFGRSEKPTDLGWYSYDRHTALMAGLAEHLDLHGATMVVHDWGGPVGLRLAVEHAQRFDRIVIMDTGLFTGHQHMSDAWKTFRDFVERTEDLPISMLVNGAVLRELSDEEKAAYDAPFPDRASKAGARAFPLMIPLTPESTGAEAGQRVLEALKTDERPMLILWADSDPILTLETGRRFAAALNRPEPEVIPGASHFLQEDQGEMIGERIASWLSR